MKVCFVSSEVYPFAKTGGLADVSGALPKELEKLGADIKIFMPKYKVVDESSFGIEHQKEFGDIRVAAGKRSYRAHIFKADLPGSSVETYFVDCPHYFQRDKIYTDDYDEDERFIFFSKVVIEALKIMEWSPEVFHLNDWQTGLIPFYIKEVYAKEKIFRNSSFLYTIHNIGYQGVFSEETLEKAGIDKKYFYSGGPAEYYEKVNFMKMGILYSDKINTVSKTYAKEILTKEYGAGMEGILEQRKDDLSGILNGVDYEEWNPETDSLISQNYSVKEPKGKKKNKQYLLKKLDMKCSDGTPVIGMISRMVNQKGYDIISRAIDAILKLNVQLVFLGSGDEEFEKLFRDLSEKHPGKLSATIGFDNELAHQIEAGADMFLMPSLYEPCGLNQIYSLKYGTVPIVRKTGGLADTVEDWNDTPGETGTGFVFEKYDPDELYKTIIRSVETFENKSVWKKLIQNGMKKDFSWGKSAKDYFDLYKKIVD